MCRRKIPCLEVEGKKALDNQECWNFVRGCLKFGDKRIGVEYLRGGGEDFTGGSCGLKGGDIWRIMEMPRTDIINNFLSGGHHFLDSCRCEFIVEIRAGIYLIIRTESHHLGCVLTWI